MLCFGLRVILPCRHSSPWQTDRNDGAQTTKHIFQRFPKRKTGKPLRIALRNSDDKETLIKSELPKYHAGRSPG